MIESTNGYSWTTAALLSGTGDLRDPKITVTPDNRLEVIAGDASQGTLETIQSAAWFSSNGTNWGSETPIGDYNYFMWRLVWHNGVGYGVSYGDITGTDAAMTTRLSTTTDGTHFTTTVPQLNPAGQVADEAGLTFLPNGTAVSLVRRIGGGPSLGRLPGTTRTGPIATSIFWSNRPIC